MEKLKKILKEGIADFVRILTKGFSDDDIRALWCLDRDEIRLLSSSPEDYEIFKSIYCEFASEPFWEKWTEELFKEVFDNYTQNGRCFVCQRSGAAKGLIAVTFGPKGDQPEELERDNIAWLSDIVVKREFRGQGIGTRLQNFMMDYLRESCKPDMVYLRTNLKGSMSEGLARKTGFEVIKDQSGEPITQDCFFERTRDNIPATDTRKFLAISLKGNKEKCSTKNIVK